MEEEFKLEEEGLINIENLLVKHNQDLEVNYMLTMDTMEDMMNELDRLKMDIRKIKLFLRERKTER